MQTSDPTPDALFKACGDPTRLRMLALLQQRDELCVCDLMAVLDLPQAKASRHLAVLRQAGLVASRRQAQWVHHRLTPATKVFHQQLLATIAKAHTLDPIYQQDKQALKAATTCKPGCC